MLHIVCDKQKLSEGISIVSKAVSSKSTMDILECIVIDILDNKIRLIANDLQLGIETIIEGNIVEGGSVAVNAKVFSEIIRKLPSDEVLIQVDENFTMNIKCGKAKFAIPVRETDEFPFLPETARDNNVKISQFTLKDIIRQTVFSISDNEDTRVMTGELFEIHGSTLRIASLDGHRISIRKVELKESYDDVSVIIPGKTLNEISKILNGGIDDIVSVYFTDKHVLFEFDNTIVLSRLIEGEYYNIDRMLSNNYETKLTVGKREMLECIDRTTLLIKESEKQPVIIDITDDMMQLKINSKVGSMDEDISITKEGKDILIGFNPRFLIDALRVIDDDNVTLYFVNAKSPCFIRDDNESYIYLILPVNISA